MSLERVNPVAERAMLAARNEFEIVMRVEGERHARAAFGTIWSAVKREPRWVQAACPQCENSSLAKYRALPPDSGWTLRCNPCGWSGTTPRLGPHRKDFSLCLQSIERIRRPASEVVSRSSEFEFVEYVYYDGWPNQ
jgi:hypothetical protein